MIHTVPIRTQRFDRFNISPDPHASVQIFYHLYQEEFPDLKAMFQLKIPYLHPVFFPDPHDLDVLFRSMLLVSMFY
jgi:hypothetical protein